ncbi:MAG: acetate--CoA ligase family protein [Candidatus Micrarchaeota archaeon]|nr:acetate--CoA ligase family protein [Candidatus Micrarchaeota archaeon]MDE1846535.1 acetate--CoA ligase family protein [Candidatus Micrarchaeota archaeon]
MQLVEYTAAARLLNSYGIKSVDSRYVRSADDAIRFSGGKKIALKAISSKALHKTKAGLIKLNLLEGEEISTAFADLERRARKFKPYKILAQKMSAPGIEIIIGGREDRQFGRMLLLGLGGIYVETFKDFALRVCPITRFDAKEMIAQLKSRSVVTYSGKSEKMLEELLLRASRLISESKLSELDLNPVIIREDGYEVVDIRILR